MPTDSTIATAAPTRSAPARRRWARRAGAVALSVALVGALPAAGAGAVAASAQDANADSAAVAAARVNLQVLHAIETEELADELYLQINGKTVWSAADSIEDGGTIAVNRKAKVGDTVTLIDEDGPFDGDDVLGSDTIDDTEGILTFGNFGTEYYLEYGPA